MLRKESEAVSEGNGLVHQKEEFGFGQPAPVDEFREIKSHFDKLKELMRRLEQRLMSKPRAGRSAATSSHGGGRQERKHQDSPAHGGRRYSSTSDAWG